MCACENKLACVEEKEINEGGENKSRMKQRKRSEGLLSDIQRETERQQKREVPIKSAISNYAVINYNYHNW